MKTKHLVNILSRFTSENIIRTGETAHKDLLEIATWLKLTITGSIEKETVTKQEVSLLLKFTDSQGQKSILIDTTPLPALINDALLSGSQHIKSIGQITQMDLYIQNLPENIKPVAESIHVMTA